MEERSGRVDPFDVAKEEVEATVRKVQFMHKEWSKLLDTENTSESQKFKDLHAEIMGELQLLSYDLQEVENSINTVEQNREKFGHLTDDQLRARRAFVARSRAAHKDVQDAMTGSKAAAKMEEDRRQALLGKRSRDEQAQQQRSAYEAGAYLEQERFLQRQLVNQQEDELTELSKATQRVGQVAQTMHGELQMQQKLLDELNDDMDEQLDKMGFVMKGLGKVLKTSNGWQISGIVGLILLFVLEVILIFNT
mmetsp:Transcript_99547/g.195561  ORF Transcript_99547/g.195561 Transcript_99547/m.195561 type:complete len:251 (+) Transcript_99547:149-901(+)